MDEAKNRRGVKVVVLPAGVRHATDARVSGAEEGESMAMNQWCAEARVRQRNEVRAKRRITGRCPSQRNRMSKKIVEEEQEEEWEVVQIVAKRIRDDGGAEVILQYALRWQVVDEVIAEGPLYKKFLADEAEAAKKNPVASVASVVEEDADVAKKDEDTDVAETKKSEAVENAKKTPEKVERPARACRK